MRKWRKKVEFRDTKIRIWIYIDAKNVEVVGYPSDVIKVGWVRIEVSIQQHVKHLQTNHANSLTTIMLQVNNTTS